jgi:hydrogenase maturation protein HypF
MEVRGCRIAVDGTVQGVGFRPFVWRLATELRLVGAVRNLDGRVEIEAYGSAAALEELATRLRADAPAMATVESLTVLAVPATGAPAAGGFLVCDSGTGEG